MKTGDLSRWEKLYLELSFQLEKYIPGLIDSYYGPEEIKQRSERQKKLPLSDLASMSNELSDLIKKVDFEESRKIYLLKQCQALDTSIKVLGGEKFSFIEEVNLCFDIFPQKEKEELLEQALNQLDEFLPGKGSLQERMNLRKQRLIVPQKDLLEVLQISMDEVKKRTLKLFELPASETLEIKLTAQQPWSAYNWYLGNYKSLIEFNTDLPSLITSILETMAHEGYPGHHTEHCLKENHLYRQKNYIEHSILLVRTPESVIAEGIANVASEIIFGEKELYEWMTNHLASVGGIELDVKLETEIISARRILSAILRNSAYLLYVEGMPEDQVVSYVAKYGLMKKEEAKKRMSFVKDPLWRPYIYNYSEGYRLVSQYLGKPYNLNKFKKLLTEQIVPSQLS
ncbi:MAG: hypothetical protein ACFFBD_25890 [Candidatus Hodarchaeota archaeon]